MVGRFHLRTRAFVYLAAHHPRGELWRQQKVVNADFASVLESLTEIIPECDLATLSKMQGAESIRVAKPEICWVPLSRFWLK